MKIKDFYTFQDLTYQYNLGKLNPRPYLHDKIMSFCRLLSINYDLAKYEIEPVNPLVMKCTERGISKETNIINEICFIIPENQVQFWYNLRETECISALINKSTIIVNIFIWE